MSILTTKSRVSVRWHGRSRLVSAMLLAAIEDHNKEVYSRFFICIEYEDNLAPLCVVRNKLGELGQRQIASPSSTETKRQNSFLRLRIRGRP